MSDRICVVGPFGHSNSVGLVMRELLWHLRLIGAPAVGVDVSERQDHPSHLARVRRHLVAEPAGDDVVVHYSGHAGGQQGKGAKEIRFEVPDSFLMQQDLIDAARAGRLVKIAAPSQAAFDYFTARGVEQVEYIPHGVNLNLIKPLHTERFTAESIALLRKFRWLRSGVIDDRTFIIGHSGYLQQRKGTKELIEAVIQTFRKRDNVALMLHGPLADWGEALGEMEHLCKCQLGAPPILYCDQMLSPREMRVMRHLWDAGAFPSYYEGFGLPALECLAQGVPVVVPQHSGFLELDHDDDPFQDEVELKSVHWLRGGTREKATNPNVKEDMGLTWWRPDIDEIGDTLAELAEQRDHPFLRTIRKPDSIAKGMKWSDAAIHLCGIAGVDCEAPPCKFDGDRVRTAILTTADPEKTGAAVRSVRAQEGVVSEVGLVNNGMPNPEFMTIDIGSDLATTSLKLITSDNKLGVCARNLAWTCDGLAPYEYAACLDNDAVMGKGVLAAAVEYFREHHDVGLIGIKSLRPDGKIDHYGARLLGLDKVGGEHLGEGADDGPGFCAPLEVDYTPGVCQIIRADLLRAIGYNDPDFAPLWYEDVALCAAVRAAGYKVVVLGSVSIVHDAHGASKGREKEAEAKAKLYAERWGWLHREAS